MIKWFLRGVSRRRLTTRYPREPELAPARFRARALIDAEAVAHDTSATYADVCLPNALTLDSGGRLRLDAGRCIACGLCADVHDGGPLAMDPGFELATMRRSRLIADGPPGEENGSDRALGATFRRSLHIRHIDTGSDGAIEQEIAALLNPYYDMHRLGLFFTASPRHADILLVTGPVTRPMEQPLRRTYEAMPEPRVVVAAGTDACSGSIWTEPEVRGGVDQVLPVDAYIPGDPPTPISLLHGLLLAAGRVPEATPPRLTELSPAPTASAGGGGGAT